jgi:nitroreductase
MDTTGFIPLDFYPPGDEVLNAEAEAFKNRLATRRSVRHFSDRPVAREVIENLIKTAATAPSGAHRQPWTFCAVSDPVIKAQIRAAAEQEEYENYHSRMPDEWLQDLKPFATDWQKEFLTVAPWLIVVFRKPFDPEYDADGTTVVGRHKNYYVPESVGIACGFLISAIHIAGLVTLTHTPSPMQFLQQILGRPEHEKPFLLLPVGYPAEGAMVPNLHRKALHEVAFFYE